MRGIDWNWFLLFLSISFRLLTWSFHQKSVIHEIYMNYSRDKKTWFRWTIIFLGNVSRNVFFRNLPHILFGDCDFYNNSSVSEFARIRWRKASRKGRSVVVWTGDLTARHEIHVLDIWHAYYSGIATFIRTRPLVILQESGDARLQKGTVHNFPYLFEAWRSWISSDRFPCATDLHEFSS